MDNVNQNKMDTNLMQRQGQQTWQADNGSTQTQTAGGHTVIDGSGAMSNLPVNMKLSQLASSGFQESARQSQVQAQTALDGYNHSVTSGWSQLSQLSHQTGSSDSISQGSENSKATNASRGASMMMSAAENYAKANNVSTQEAYNKLMDISNQGSLSAGVKTTLGGGINIGVAKWGAEGIFQRMHAIQRGVHAGFRIQAHIPRICDMTRTARRLMIPSGYGYGYQQSGKRWFESYGECGKQ
jgi:conjugal transfer mating pair stabilization protein TraG